MSVIPKNQVTVVPVQLNGINEKVSEYNADASAVLAECDNFQVRYDGLLEPRSGYIALQKETSSFSSTTNANTSARRILSSAFGLSIAGPAMCTEYTQYGKIKNSADNAGYSLRNDYRVPFVDPELVTTIRPVYPTKYTINTTFGITPESSPASLPNIGLSQLLSDCFVYDYCEFPGGTSTAGTSDRSVTMTAFVGNLESSATTNTATTNLNQLYLQVYVTDTITGDIVAKVVRSVDSATVIATGDTFTISQVKAFGAGARGLIAVSGFTTTGRVPFCNLYQIELSSVTEIYKGIRATVVNVPMNAYIQAAADNNISMIDVCWQQGGMDSGTVASNSLINSGYLATQSNVSNALGILYTYTYPGVGVDIVAASATANFAMGKTAGALDRISGLGICFIPGTGFEKVLVAADIDGLCKVTEFTAAAPAAASGTVLFIGATGYVPFSAAVGSFGKAYLICQSKEMDNNGLYSFVVCVNNFVFNGPVEGPNSAAVWCDRNLFGTTINTPKEYQDILFTSKPFFTPAPGRDIYDLLSAPIETSRSRMVGIRCVVAAPFSTSVQSLTTSEYDGAAGIPRDATTATAFTSNQKNLDYREYVVDLSGLASTDPYSAGSVLQLPVISSIAAGNSLALPKEYCQRNVPFSRVTRSLVGIFDISLATIPRTFAIGAIQRVNQFGVYRLNTESPYLYGSSYYESSTFTSGGQACVSSGGIPYELGFPSRPIITQVYSQAFAGGVPAGTYTYSVIFEWSDDTGNTYQSPSSDLTTPYVVGAASKVYVRIPRPSLGKMFQMYNPVRANIYRASATQGSYRYVGSICPPAGGMLAAGQWFTHYVFEDTVSDSDIAASEPPYYVPGLPAQPLPRQGAGTLRCITAHKDRLFGIDDFGNIRFTGPKVFGEGFWWSDAFYITVPGGQGRPTALASFESKIIVFKKDSVYAIYGDGPPESGGNGTEYSPPERISEGIGCDDPRSVVVTPIGVFFRSARGIELLASGGKTVFIGESVQRKTAFDGSYPYTLSAMYDPAMDCVKFLISSVQFPSSLTDNVYSQKILCFYIKSNSWTTHTVLKSSTTPHTMLDIAAANIDGQIRTVIVTKDGIIAERTIGGTTGGRYYNDDNSSVVSSTYTTSWLKMNNTPTSQLRCWGYESQGIHMDSHSTTITGYANYTTGSTNGSSQFTTTSIGSSNASPVTPETLELQPAKENVQAIKVKVTCQAFSDGTNTNSGNGTCKFFGGGFSIGQKPGLPKIPAVQS